jgi:hypothetical protein
MGRFMATTFSGEQEIEALYVGYFGRAGDPAGVSYWVSQLNSGLSIAQIAASFSVQTEATTLYGFLASPTGNNPAAITNFVTQVYQDLFNRAPDSGGLAYWTAQLQTANGNPQAVGQFILNVITGAQGSDASSIQNKVTVAQDFTDSLTAAHLPYNTAADQIAHSAIAATTPFPSSVTTEESAVSNYISGQTSGGSPTPPAPIPIIPLTVSGDTVHLSTTTAASTVSLTGADLTAYPSATFGTVAELIAAGTTSVTDSGGNFTLNASNNNHATTFNFGTGVVSGSDPASSAGITYSGVTTYITSANGDTVTLSAAAQNVTASNDSNTINLGSLAYTGTLNLNAGSGGTDTINATVGGNLGGGTIDGTGGNEHIALVLSAAGTETLSTGEYNTITGTTAGSITFTGGTFGTDHITFADAGTVTAIASVGNYNLSTAGDTIALTNVADSVAGAASGSDTVNLGALTYTSTVAFGAAGFDTIHVTVGGDISDGTITSGGATVGLALSGSGAETLSTAEYNLFNATSITGGSFGTDTIIFSNAGTVTANANVGNYDLSTAGNSIALTNVADNVTGAASGSDNVDLATLTYTGTVAFGASGSDTIHATVGGDISGGTITTGGATVGLNLSGGAGTETLNTAEYNLFNATGINLDGINSTFSNTTITLSDALTGGATLNSHVGNYDLANATNSVTLGAAGQSVTGGSGSDSITANAAGGNTIQAGGGADTIDLQAGHGSADLVIQGQTDGVTRVGGASFTNPAMTNGDFLLGFGSADLVHNAQAGVDHIQLGTATALVDLIGTAFGTTNTNTDYYARGSLSGGTFTFNSSGADTLLFRGDGTHDMSAATDFVILIGVNHDPTLSSNIVTV